jgi:hypothetical protein
MKITFDPAKRAKTLADSMRKANDREKARFGKRL